jgi:ATP synthase protein I
VDEGILVKCGADVRVSTRNAVLGQELGELKRMIEERFKQVDEFEKKSRDALYKMEADLVRRFMELGKIEHAGSRPKDSRWEEQVGEKETRKLRARRHKDRSIWFGLGTFGVVGWSVVVPTLLGLFAGIWLDRNLPSPFSWTLMLFWAGCCLAVTTPGAGCTLKAD